MPHGLSRSHTRTTFLPDDEHVCTFAAGAKYKVQRALPEACPGERCHQVSAAGERAAALVCEWMRWSMKCIAAEDTGMR